MKYPAKPLSENDYNDDNNGGDDEEEEQDEEEGELGINRVICPRSSQTSRLYMI